jgi:hypothetical protein
MKPLCIACQSHPAHTLDLGDGTEATFCEEHWQQFEGALGETAERYYGLIADGVHPAFAERMLLVES